MTTSDAATGNPGPPNLQTQPDTDSDHSDHSDTSPVPLFTTNIHMEFPFQPNQPFNVYKTVQKVITKFFDLPDQVQFVVISSNKDKMSSIADFPDLVNWNKYFTHADTKLYRQGSRVQVLACLHCSKTLINLKATNLDFMEWLKASRNWTFAHQSPTLTAKSIGLLVNTHPGLGNRQQLAAQLYNTAKSHAKSALKINDIPKFDLAVLTITEYANEADVGPGWQLRRDSILKNHWPIQK